MWDPSKDRKERRRRASERSEAFDRYKVDDSSWRGPEDEPIERAEHLPGDMSGFCPACGHTGCDNPQ